MIFNEVPSLCFKNALKECYRVLKGGGSFLISVIHPNFTASLQKRDLLKRAKDGTLTMPGSGSLRLPIVIRSLENYRTALQEAGFQYEETEAASSKEVLKLKAGLRNVEKFLLL